MGPRLVTALNTVVITITGTGFSCKKKRALDVVPCVKVNHDGGSLAADPPRAELPQAG